MDTIIRRIAIGERNRAQEFLTELLLVWRTELWPNGSDDPILHENLRLRNRDWREVDLRPPIKRPVMAGPLFGLPRKKGVW